MANKDKYINIAELKKKLNYIYRANGVSEFTREAINSAICKLPFVLKSEPTEEMRAKCEEVVNKIRAEAIKEFAERLKSKCRDSVELDDYRMTVVTKSDIDTTVKEFVKDINVLANPEQVKGERQCLN